MRNDDKHTDIASARLNVLRYLEEHAPNCVRPAAKSQIGYAAFPGYRFKSPQGAAFAVSKIVYQLEREGLVRYGSTDFGRGSYLTGAGLAYLRSLQPTSLT